MMGEKSSKEGVGEQEEKAFYSTQLASNSTTATTTTNKADNPTFSFHSSNERKGEEFDDDFDDDFEFDDDDDKDGVVFDTGEEPDNDGDGNISFNISQLPREMRNILAGGIAGMVAKSVVAPFERIKILFQVSTAKFQFRQVPVIARNIVMKEGVAALWKGNTATMIRVFPYAGIQFMVFDRVKRYFLLEHQQHNHFLLRRKDTVTLQKRGTKPNINNLTPLESLIAGMIAGATSVVCTYPLDLTRAQLAVLLKQSKKKKDPTSTTLPNTNTASQQPFASSQNGSKNKGFFMVLMQNYKNRGLLGLFRGLTPTLLGIIPYAGIAFSLNEQGKQKIQKMAGRDLKTIERMQCGAFAGLFAQTLTYPLEVTRRRMQTIGVVPMSSKNEAATVALGLGNGGNSKPSQPSQAPPKAMNTIGTMRVLYREQGIPGFFKGVSMNWVKGPIAFSISFTVFDLVTNMMESDAEKYKRLSRITSKA